MNEPDRIMNPSNLTKKKTRKIVKAYRQMLGYGDKVLSLAKFASRLNGVVEHLGLGVSYQTVKNWEDGIHRPDDAFILHLLNCSTPGTWQHSFANDLLAVQWPELYEPVSEIGKRVLSSF